MTTAEKRRIGLTISISIALLLSTACAVVAEQNSPVIPSPDPTAPKNTFLIRPDAVENMDAGKFMNHVVAIRGEKNIVPKNGLWPCVQDSVLLKENKDKFAGPAADRQDPPKIKSPGPGSDGWVSITVADSCFIDTSVATVSAKNSPTSQVPILKNDPIQSSRIRPETVPIASGKNSQLGFAEAKIGEIQMGIDRAKIDFINYIMRPDIIRVLLPAAIGSLIPLVGIILSYFEIKKKERSTEKAISFSLPNLEFGTTDLDLRTKKAILSWIETMVQEEDVRTGEYTLDEGINVKLVRNFLQPFGILFSVGEGYEGQPAAVKVGDRFIQVMKNRNWERKTNDFEKEAKYEEAKAMLQGIKDALNLGHSPTRHSSSTSRARNLPMSNILDGVISNFEAIFFDKLTSRIADIIVPAPEQKKPTPLIIEHNSQQK